MLSYSLSRYLDTPSAKKQTGGKEEKENQEGITLFQFVVNSCQMNKQITATS